MKPDQGAASPTPEEREQQMDKVKTVAIIGAGPLGTSLARAVAATNLEVILIENSEERAAIVPFTIEKILDKDIRKWRVTETEKGLIQGRIRVTSDLDEVKNADLVIEAITEDFELKEALFCRLDELCDPHVVFITTTAALSITKLASRLTRADRFIGMNIQIPVLLIPIVEVVSGLKTSSNTRQLIREFAAHLKKEVITVNEFPGYVTTRVILPFINEAMYVVMEGVATAEDVDKAIKLSYNLPMGPLALADSIGLDIVFQWMENLFRDLGDLKYRPCPMLRKLVYANHLGVKTGEGFFFYNKE